MYYYVFESIGVQGRKWLPITGGQVVMRRGAADGGAFYAAKNWGGMPPPTFTYAPGVL